MLDIIKAKRTPAQVKPNVMALRKEFDQIQYGFQNIEEALAYIRKA
jgi:hypothetical protein